MQDKNYDDFFDEKAAEESPEEKLMAMVDTVKKAPAQKIMAGKMTAGKVLSIGKEYLFVDVGQKNEAVIKKVEYLDKEGNVTVKSGDMIEAFVVSTENDEIVMSRSLSGRKAGTQDLIDAMESKIPVDGKITGINKGGFNVTIMGRKAFCPFSHIDLKYVDEPNAYLLKRFPFVISRVEKRGRNIVLSRLPLLEKDLGVKIDELEKCIEDKKVFKGAIRKITKFGLFVDIGDIEGLVHISEVSWERAQNLEDSFNVGQIVECIILKIEKNEPLRNSKISLSIRHVGENPWENVSAKITIGSVVEGTIARLTKFGAFVQLLPGIEGLIHISEMSWGKRIRHPADVVSEGQAVKVTILAINETKQSISCSLKDIADNPWNSVPEKYPVGSKVNGTVVSEKKYGFFIDLDENITGLLVHGKVAKDKKGSIKKGDTIEVCIEEIDIDDGRISLSYGIAVEAEKDGKSSGQNRQKPEISKKKSSDFGNLLKAAIEKKK